MCSRWLRGFPVALLWAGSLAAQDQAAVLRRMEQQLDSMQRVIQLRDSAHARASTSDTVVAGGLRIATSPGLRPLAQAAAVEAWGRLKMRLGASVVERVAIPVMDFGDAYSPVPLGADTSVIARGFEQSASNAIWHQQGTMFMDWLRGNDPGTEFSASDLRIVAEELVKIPARPNNACFEGDRAACAASLGIRVGADTLAEWYPPEAWPRLAGLVGGHLSEHETVARRDCMGSGDGAACRTILTPSHLTLPVGVAGRRFLVQQALELGGPGSFGRLTEPGDVTLEDRLSNAAGMPLDTLLARWGAAVRAAPSRGPARPAWELLLGAAWSALLLATLLGGSRWR
jgi:hypothetical protein